MIEFVLRAASTLENTTGEQRPLRSSPAAILFLVIQTLFLLLLLECAWWYRNFAIISRPDPREFTLNLSGLVFSRG